jgi:hypothetical protein
MFKLRTAEPRGGYKICAMLKRDWERLVTFFNHPQEPWTDLRTTDIVGESGSCSCSHRKTGHASKPVN